MDKTAARPVYEAFKNDFTDDEFRADVSEEMKHTSREIQQIRRHQIEFAFGWEMHAAMCKDREICIDGLKAKPKRKTLLERQVPHWCKARRKEDERRLTFGAEAVFNTWHALNDEAQKILSDGSNASKKPERTERLFAEMYAENKKVAFWYANNRAQVFGELTQPPLVKLTRRNFNLPERELALFRYKELSREQRRGLKG